MVSCRIIVSKTCGLGGLVTSWDFTPSVKMRCDHPEYCFLRPQIKPQDAIGIRIRVVIEKFAANTTIGNASDLHRFLDKGMLGVIEGEGNQEHIVNADGMGSQHAQPQPSA